MDSITYALAQDGMLLERLAGTVTGVQYVMLYV